ncbi:MAG: hypothetical protein OQJ95_01510 [Kangiella sp.]|jgi:hypothetical protein|nr:hypothetical protein [Kangiella sp.]MCW9027983.1 hypothetical protein [Kangiella sp.]
MKKALYGVALMSSMILTACTDGPEEPKIPGTGDGSTKLVAPVFAPGDGELPIPNDLLFNGTADLTLNIPTDDPTDMSDPQNAINALDGWSTHAPFSIEFRGAIDGSTVVPGQTVRLFKVSVNRPEAIPGTGIPAPTGPVTGVEAELAAGVDFVAVPASSTSVGVIPLKPLEPQASYMVVVTNGILDANGNAVISDAQFSVVKSPDPIPEGSATAGLEPVRQLTQTMLAASTSAGIDRDDVVLTYQFTVQSVANALVTANNAYVQAAADAGLRPASSFSSLMTDTTPFTGIGAANLYKGEVTLPYLLTAPTAGNPTSVLDNSWVGAQQIPTPQGPIANPLAGAPITYANPLAQKTGDEIVPLLVSVPKDPNCSKPYPVMIFQHGITSNRTAMLGIADTMASTCTAVVAMDLPLHGIGSNNQVHQGLQLASGGAIGIFEGYSAGDVRERTFGVDYIDNATSAPGPDGQADPSGAHTINLTNLVVSRDNLRQAVLDLLVLEEAIPAMDIDGDTQPDFDPDNVSFMGHSLGGIAGSKYIGLSDKVKVSVQATTSGSIAQMLDGSASFSPRIRAGLAAASGVPADDPSFESAVLKPFLFAAQTVVDSGDPVNYAVLARALDIPTLALQVQNDQVVPNQVAGAPLAGSIPHAALFGLPTLTESTATDRAFLKFVSGDHASPLSPAADAAVTVSMQTAIANFIASGGTQVVVSDPSLVEP